VGKFLIRHSQPAAGIIEKKVPEMDLAS